MTRPPRNPESGYALLFVYMMAASLAIMLYMEIPRVAFEAQRDKEQLLIDRGEQYKRAIQLYVRKYNRFPPDIDALEKTQNLRFLRKQYLDPMTGKNEWRLIHVGPGGVFTDSKVYGQQKKDAAGAPQTFITEMQSIGGSSSSNQSVNLATRRRPSDDPGTPGDPNNPGGQPNNPGQPGPISGPVMVLPDGRIVPATPSGQPVTTNQQPFGNLPPGFPPGFQPPSGVGFQQGSNPSASGVPQPGQPGFQSTPNGALSPPPSAANLINQILTTPRPGGLNGISAATDPSAAGAGGGFGGPGGGFGSTPATNGMPVGQTQPGMAVPPSAAALAELPANSNRKALNRITRRLPTMSGNSSTISQKIRAAVAERRFRSHSSSPVSKCSSPRVSSHLSSRPPNLRQGLPPREPEPPVLQTKYFARSNLFFSNIDIEGITFLCFEMLHSRFGVPKTEQMRREGRWSEKYGNGSRPALIASLVLFTKRASWTENNG